MPDWQKLVRERLSSLALDAEEKEEVQAELAGHLEDSYEALLREGAPERAAADRALSQVSNWRELRSKISAAKRRGDSMQKRALRLWIPGLLTLTLSTIFLMTLQKQGYQPRVVSWSGPDTMLLYTPWLLSLPLFGALGAYLSLRAGGSQRTILFAAIFPVLTFAATLFVILPVSFIVDSHVDHKLRMAGFLKAFVEWVVIPGAALLAGGLPAEFILSRRSTRQEPLAN